MDAKGKDVGKEMMRKESHEFYADEMIKKLNLRYIYRSNCIQTAIRVTIDSVTRSSTLYSIGLIR